MTGQTNSATFLTSKLGSSQADLGIEVPQLGHWGLPLHVGGLVFVERVDEVVNVVMLEEIEDDVFDEEKVLEDDKEVEDTVSLVVYVVMEEVVKDDVMELVEEVAVELIEVDDV